LIIRECGWLLWLPGDPLYCVVNREDMDPLAILDIRECLDTEMQRKKSYNFIETIFMMKMKIPKIKNQPVT
jgi:hypothetical protein